MNRHYEIKINGEASEEQLVKGLYLVMVNVARIPHIGMAIDGKLFSLSVKGVTVDGDLRSLLRAIHQKRLECIFVQLSVPGHYSSIELREEVKKRMLSYTRVNVGETTCLAPVKDVCNALYGTEVQDVNFIYDLLPRLAEQKVTGSYFHYNLSDHLESGSFFLEKYTMADIDEEIRKSLDTVTA